jgi:hypothetical protein
MPFSWVFVPTSTSDKMRECLEGDRSAKKFESCLRKIIKEDGGTVNCLGFDAGGAKVYLIFGYSNDEQKAQIIEDIGGEQDDVLDLFSAEDIDLAAGGGEAA